MSDYKGSYRALGVSPHATDVEIEQAWRQRSHDLDPSRDPANHAAYDEVQAAYQQLTRNRAGYDFASQYAPNQSPPPQTARRRRPRILLWLAAVLVLLIVLIWTLVSLLRLNPHQDAPSSDEPTTSSITPPPPDHVELRCANITEQCPQPAVHGDSTSPASPFGARLDALVVSGLTNYQYQILCQAGYHSEWSDNYGPARDWYDQPIQPADSSCSYVGTNADAMLTGWGFSTHHPGPWTITWTLRDPAGQVVLTASFQAHVPPRA